MSFTKLTAKTVGFVDLTRQTRLFVKIHGWQPDPRFDEIKRLMSPYGVCLETDWGISG